MYTLHAHWHAREKNRNSLAVNVSFKRSVEEGDSSQRNRQKYNFLYDDDKIQ